MLKNVVVLLLPFILVSCFESDTNNEENGHTTGGIITTYRQISDQNVKVYQYGLDGTLLFELDSAYYSIESNFDTIGFNTPYLETNNLNKIWYREFDILERMKTKAVSGDALTELYIDTVFSSNHTDSVIDTINISISGDTLIESYSTSFWLDTLGVSFVGIRKTGKRKYILVEEVNFQDMWQNGIADDSAEPDSKVNPIASVPVNHPNSVSFSASQILSLSKNDTDFFKIPCNAGIPSYVFIKTNMKSSNVAINDIDFVSSITHFINPPLEEFEFLASCHPEANGYYTLTLSGNEGLYQLLVVEDNSGL